MLGACGESLQVFDTMCMRLGLLSPIQKRPIPWPERTGPSPWHEQSGLETSFAAGLLSTGIEPRHRRGPHPTDDTPLPTTVWAGQRRRGMVSGWRQRGSCPVVRRYQAPDGIRGDGTAGAQQAEVAHLHAARGQDVLQEPAYALQDVELGGARACAAGRAGGEGDDAVRERNDTAVGDGHFKDVGRKIRQSWSAMWLGLAVHVPGHLPDLRSALLQEPSGAHVFCADGAGDGRRALTGTEKLAREGSQASRVLESPPPGTIECMWG